MSLSTSFSHITMVSGCGRELNAQFSPDTLTWYSTQSHYTDTELTSSSSTFLMLSQAKEQLVPFLKSSVLPDRGSNPQPPGHKAPSSTTEPLCRSTILALYTEQANLTTHWFDYYNIDCWMRGSYSVARCWSDSTTGSIWSESKLLRLSVQKLRVNTVYEQLAFTGVTCLKYLLLW